MQLQGTITNIVPDGGYQSQNGYINTFQMTISTPSGIYTGQIGSKAQVYPIGVGQPIMIDMTESRNGVKFKKVDPKFAGTAPQQPYAPPAPPQGSKFPQAALDEMNGKTGYTAPPAVAVQGNSTNTSIEKQCSLKAAVEYLKGKPDTTSDEVVVVAWKFFSEFISAPSQF
jgi:hypothetical protein